ncbi:hypothetical protein [Thermoactinospora rubra]|uniref:hypothetical protein n=1 Tax=Thermoactinospora rubra TaxID=1088767 RepID=UPI00117D2490|nr:hypothetical protein [Thermoactinospora rubra]
MHLAKTAITGLAMTGALLGTTHVASAQTPAATAPLVALGNTKNDCPIVASAFVWGGRLWARTTVTCNKRHSIRIDATLFKKGWLRNYNLAQQHKTLYNFKGTTYVQASVPCNSVSGKRIYWGKATLLDVRLLGFPIEVFDRPTGVIRGC